MEEKKITVLPGDGIGPEVTHWACETLNVVAKGFHHKFSFCQAMLGHTAIQATGNPLPPTTLEACQNSDAILLGAVGDPIYDQDPSLIVRPEQGLLALRKELELYCNLRPIRIFDQLMDASSLKPEILSGVDILFFRELTGGIYFGQRGRNAEETAAKDTMAYSVEEIERIARKAFAAAARRSRRLHSIDKANVLETSRLWRSTVQKVAADFPQVELTHMYVDNAAMQLIRDPQTV